MHFQISRDAFYKAISKVQGIVEKKHTIPILANVLIETEDENIIITATDLEVGLKSKFKADIQKKGKVTISAKKLFEIIKELPDENIDFRTKENFWVEINCANSNFNLVGLSPDEFPKFPDIKDKSNVIEKDLISEMIEKTIFSVSNDETKFNLTGIFVKTEDIEKNNLSFISTDGHRLSIIKRNMSDNWSNIYQNGFILPKKGILELKRNIENTNENLEIGLSDNNFYVKNNDTQLIMRIIDGEFPDYKRVIPEEGSNSAIIDREEFFYALKRISVLSSEKSKGIKINLTKNSLLLTSSNPDLGEAKETLNINYNGDDISIGFNARYILDILQVIREKRIILNLKDNISPVRISPEEDEDYLSVIMPMRL